MLWSGVDVGALEDKRAYRLMCGRAWISGSHDGGRFLSRRERVWKGTPPLLALLIIEKTGLFSLQTAFMRCSVSRAVPSSSVPAASWRSRGLRALFFALADIIRRSRCLNHGLSLLLVLIGLKSLAEDLREAPSRLMLLAAAGALAGSIGLSLLLDDDSDRPGGPT